MTAVALPQPAAGSALAKYRAVWAIALRQRAREPALLIGTAALYALLLYVFAQLWRVLLSGTPGSAARAGEYLWYLAVAEWILCAQPRFHLDIEREVRSGDVACQLTRPISYLGSRLAHAAAELCVNLALLAPIGACVAVALVGLPERPGGLLIAVALGLLASVLWMLCTALIGLSAFWLQDTSPLYWVFQKLAFVLGGLMVPLDLYPVWLERIALASPFSALLYTPARLVFGGDTGLALAGAAQIAFWIALAALALRFVHRRALLALESNGG